MIKLAIMRDGAVRRTRPCGGFTLLELLIVITMILIIMAIASIRYDRSVAYTKEVNLHHDLAAMRQAIEQYTLDNQKTPQSLDELVSAGYLGQIPIDPVSGAKDWTTDASDILLTADQGSAGIRDVHSGSSKLSPFETRPIARGEIVGGMLSNGKTQRLSLTLHHAEMQESLR